MRQDKEKKKSQQNQGKGNLDYHVEGEFDATSIIQLREFRSSGLFREKDKSNQSQLLK